MCNTCGCKSAESFEAEVDCKVLLDHIGKLAFEEVDDAQRANDILLAISETTIRERPVEIWSAESFEADGDGYGGNYNNASWNDSLFDEAQHFFEHMEKASTNALSLTQMGAIERGDYYFYIDEKIANIESRMRSLLGKSGMLKKGHMERLNIDAPMEAEEFEATKGMDTYAQPLEELKIKPTKTKVGILLASIVAGGLWYSNKMKE